MFEKFAFIGKDPVSPLVGRWVGRSVIISQKGGKFDLHAPFGALVFFCILHTKTSEEKNPRSAGCLS